jgi:hypothetical protein
MVTTKVEARAAGINIIELSATIDAYPDQSNLLTKNDVIAALSASYTQDNQEIGNEVALSDLYFIIESLTKVKKSRITKLTIKPAAIKVDNASPTLLWERTVLVGALVVEKYSLKFQSSTLYSLYRDNTFLGTYSVATLYTIDNKLSLKVLASSYSGGDSYTFYLYPYNSDVTALDPSILVVNDAFLDITAQGGI